VSIGIFYTATMALAILFLGLMKTYNAEVYGYLFGSILSVTSDELQFTGLVALLVGGVVMLFSKEFFFIAFDQAMAEASGVPARRLFFLLLSLIAVTIVVSLKTVGAILVFALLLIPPSIAYQLTSSLHRMMTYSIVIGVVVSCLGVLISFQLDLPAGPAIVLLCTALFFVAVVLSPKRLRYTVRA
jgi:manganese/iron transport system permease protein